MPIPWLLIAGGGGALLALDWWSNKDVDPASENVSLQADLDRLRSAVSGRSDALSQQIAEDLAPVEMSIINLLSVYNSAILADPVQAKTVQAQLDYAHAQVRALALRFEATTGVTTGVTQKQTTPYDDALRVGLILTGAYFGGRFLLNWWDSRYKNPPEYAARYLKKGRRR